MRSPTWALITVNSARSYSRRCGHTSPDVHTNTPGNRSASRRLAAASCSALAYAWRKQTASARQPPAHSSAARASTWSASSGRSTAPVGPSRSSMPRTASRGTSGTGASVKKFCGSGSRRRRISRMSSMPLVTSRPTALPERSMSVLTARVVPWTKDRIAAGSIARRAASIRSPSVTAEAGARGVVGTFSTSTSPEPSSSRTKSVNVPPMSTPRRNPGPMVALRLLRPAPEADGRHPEFSEPVAERRAVAALHLRQASDLGVGSRRQLGEQLARLPGGRRVRHVAQVGESGELVVQANGEVKSVFVRFRPPLNEFLLDAVELRVELSRRSGERSAGREPLGARHPGLDLRSNIAHLQHGVVHLAQFVADVEQEVELLPQMRIQDR